MHVTGRRLSLVIAMISIACGGGGGSAPPGGAETVYVTAVLAPTSECPNGGVGIDVGLDDDGNGALASDEVDESRSLCRGNGASALQRIEPEVAGSHCRDGGVALLAGIDSNADGVLADAEVTSTQYVCAGGAAPALVDPFPVSVGGGRSVRVSSTLGTGDRLLADGARGKFYAFDLPASGLLEAAVTGDVELHVFRAACLADPNVEDWGPCFVGRAPIEVDGGAHVLLVKSLTGVTPWETTPFIVDLAASSAVRLEGELDTNFGSGGMAVTSTPGLYSLREALAVEADGDIVVAWGSEYVDETVFHVARYTSAGALDPQFGSGGQVTTELGADGVALAVAIDGEGRIVVAGQQKASPGLLVARYGPDGTLDEGFGTSGVARVGIMPSTDYANFALVLQPDGRIVVAGPEAATEARPTYRLFVARLTGDGSADPDFGDGDGIVSGPDTMSLEGGVSRALLGPSGELVVAASKWVVRYAADGSLDTAFGGDGITELPTGAGYARDMAIAPGGRVLVAARSGDQDVSISRLMEDGSRDAAFGAAGVVSFTTDVQEASLMLFDARGDLVVMGHDRNAAFERTSPRVERYSATGSLDATFGQGGAVSLPDACQEDAVWAPDGSLFCATMHEADLGFGVIRLR
jgi:uncharacterized delta-60 repeat protein